MSKTVRKFDKYQHFNEHCDCPVCRGKKRVLGKSYYDAVANGRAKRKRGEKNGRCERQANRKSERN